MSQSGEPFDAYYQWLGIPPDEQPPNHYRLLGIQLFEDNCEVIQNAADRQMVHLRTFQSGPRAALSQKLLNEVAVAKLCLLSPEKKDAYDQQLSTTTPEPEPPVSASVSPESAVDPLIRTAGRRSPATAAVLRRTARRRSPAWGAMVALLLAAATLAVLAVVYFGGRGESANRLVLEWPLDERSGARMTIDGQPYDLVRDPVEAGPERLEFRLEPGTHTVRITRPGFQPLVQSFELEPGTRVELAAAFAKAVTAANVFLAWPAAERTGATLHIDGQLCDLTTGPVASSPTELQFRLDAGEHTMRIERDGETVFDRRFTINATDRVNLFTRTARPATGQLVLKWPTALRTNAVLQIDGKRLAFNRDPDGGAADLSYLLSPGEHALHISIDGSPPVDTSVELAAGQRKELDVEKLLGQGPARLTLVWPVADRRDATLEIDGQVQDLATALPGSDEDELIFEVASGPHTVRIVRPDRAMFEQELGNLTGDARVTVTTDPLPPSHPTGSELERLRKEFQSAYRSFDEYKKWEQETEPAAKLQQRQFLIARLAAEAEKGSAGITRPFVAFDESIRLALESDEFVLADGIVKNAVKAGVFGEDAGKRLREKVWEQALESSRFDSLVDYLKSQKMQGRTPEASEQSRIIERLPSLAQIESDYLAVESGIRELCAQHVFTGDQAVSAQVAVYLQAGRGGFATPDDVLDVGNRILAFVPLLFAAEIPQAAQQAESLVDEIAALRRKAVTDERATAEHRTLAGKLNDEAKRLRDLTAQFVRVIDAQKEIALGNGTPAHHKLIGLWMLQSGRFDEAAVHLRESGEDDLEKIGRPLPEKASELAELADDVERESRKTRYAKRQEDALLDYARHLRRLALAKNDDSLSIPARATLQEKLQPPRTDDDYDRRFPKGKWVSLFEVITVDGLRERIKQDATGTWSVLDDGTVVAGTRALSKLELPLEPETSYGIRFVCWRTEGYDVNVNLPLGDSAVLLALGTSPRQYSGLQLLDGKKVGEAGNLATLKRSDFAFQKDVPVAIEIQVEVLKAELQSAKQRKMTGGQDWALINVMINNRIPLPASAPLTIFSVPQNYALSRNVLGFSSRAHVSFRNIELMRK